MIIVNNQIWYIIPISPKNNKLMRSDGSYALGVTDNIDKAIYINNSVNSDMFEKILTHEICHIFCFEYGIVIPIEYEEILCDFVATYGRELFVILDNYLKKSRKFQKKLG